jgi:hypothetical protein
MKSWFLLLPVFWIACIAFSLVPTAHSGPVPVLAAQVVPLGTVATAAPAWHQCGDLFDRVFAVMNRSPKHRGCMGCHIAPEPVPNIPWFGKDKESVLQTLETGITPDGQQLSQIPVEGGRSGELGFFLHNAVMPLGGKPWADKQLMRLDDWLITYEN